MDIRTLDLPTRVVYGVGSRLQVGEAVSSLGGSRCLVVTEAGVVAAGLTREVERSLADASIAFEVFDGAVPNPEVDSVDEGARVARELRADCLVGVGGGSSMDTAKLIGLLMTEGTDSVYEYFAGRRPSRPILPLVAVPTTAGTGSEVAWAAVVNRKSTGERLSLGSPYIAARVAVVDPTFAAGMPPKLAAGTGLDALAHAVEGLTSRRATPFGDAFAAEAIRRIGRSLVPLVQQPGNLEAAGDMALAATMAGFVLNYSTIHLVHAMGRPLSAWYGLHHGLSMGILLPHALEYARVGNAAAFGRVARLLGVFGELEDEALAEAAIDAVRAIQRDAGIPATLSAVGVPAADADRLADTVAAYPGPLDACPRPVSREDLGRLFDELLPTP